MNHLELLEVQRIDIEIAQLNHKLAKLPEREQLETLNQQQVDLATKSQHTALTRIEILTRQRKFEDEAQIVAAKIATDESRLYGGEVKALRDLQALQNEINTLTARQSNLEEQALEAMEEGETLTTQANDLATQTDTLENNIAKLQATIASAETTINNRKAQILDRRQEIIATLDNALVQEYETLKPVFGAATAVHFVNGNCVGCPSMMPAMEIDRMKRASEDVLTCDECNRIVLL